MILLTLHFVRNSLNSFGYSGIPSASGSFAMRIHALFSIKIAYPNSLSNFALLLITNITKYHDRFILFCNH